MNTEIIRIINADTHKNNKHYVYAHILEDEQYPFYIGIGTQQLNKGLFSRAKNKSGRSSLWKEKTKDKKYYIIICSSSNDYELIKKQEIEAISEMRSFIDSDAFVNIAAGGAGCIGYKHTEEHKQWLKENYSGNKNPMFGKIISEETRKRMSLSQIGRKHKQESIEKLRNIRLKTGYLGPKGEFHHKAKVVIQLDPITKKEIKRFNCMKEAAEYVGVSNQVIGKSIRQNFKVKNYYWCYGS